jgi:cation diffusion facilitator CzcD-associated flavoprotein CzcO
MLLNRVRKHFSDEYVAEHFTPSYNPWDQRLCLIPNEDLFKAIKSDRASVVTAHIDRITKKGIRLTSGEELEADIIISATGLNMRFMGSVEFTVEDEPVNFAERFTYKGLMQSGVPNLVQTFGYINASWTLRADLTSEYSCRLINRMDELGVRQCTPELREQDQGMDTRMWIDDFSSGYMQRVLHLFPRQGDHAPWQNTQNFTEDKKLIRKAPLEDGALIFSNPKSD